MPKRYYLCKKNDLMRKEEEGGRSMSRKIAMTLEKRERGYEMLRLQQLIRDHGFEPVVFYDHPFRQLGR